MDEGPWMIDRGPSFMNKQVGENIYKFVQPKS
jgi:hypothetical protein